MTWKSYAAVSGATVLAGWLASSPPASVPARNAATAASPRRAAASAPGTDIQAEAARLHARLRSDRVYAEPRRDLFRFAARTEASAEARGRTRVIEGVADVPAVPEAPAAPRVGLSGVAEEQVDGRTERTAVLSSPMGVLLVRENEDVFGFYRVVRIENEAVELLRTSDGSAVRLTLGSSIP